jgi:hypothetical protein
MSVLTSRLQELELSAHSANDSGGLGIWWYSDAPDTVNPNQARRIKKPAKISHGRWYQAATAMTNGVSKNKIYRRFANF